MRKEYKVLSIYAWRNEHGWDWNNWFDAGTVVVDIEGSNRSILRTLRETFILSEYSKGRVAIDDDQYNLVIIDRRTREPLFAIEYGNRED